MSDGSVEIRIGKQVLVGLLPAIPTRMALETARQKALGIVGFDDDNKPIAEPEAVSAGEFLLVLAAFVGACHPDPCWPSLNACRRDVLTYGEGVLDGLMRRHGRATAIAAAYENGKAIAAAMLQDTAAFFSEVEAEKGN